MSKPAARKATDPNASLLSGMSKKPAKQTGSKTGLREGENRVTCVLTDEQAELLRDWASTSGHTFREVTMAAADLYIENVIKQFIEDGGKLIPRSGGMYDPNGQAKQPPAEIAAMYDLTNTEPDKFAQYF